MLNPALDFPRYWKTFIDTGRTQMRDFLQPAVAEQLHRHLADEVEWSVAMRDERGTAGIVPDLRPAGETSSEYRDVLARAHSSAQGRYGFLYESYMMVKAWREARDPQNLLHRVLEYMNSPPYLQFCRQVSGNVAIRRVSAQATRFRPGMFLRRHDDEDRQEGRTVAYVINLSKDWQADWGGLLQFIAPDGRVAESFVPSFNSLSLFRVPVDHCVSFVAPWAERPRLSITGWWETLPGAPPPTVDTTG